LETNFTFKNTQIKYINFLGFRNCSIKYFLYKLLKKKLVIKKLHLFNNKQIYLKYYFLIFSINKLNII
jgi:hypothetical protein